MADTGKDPHHFVFDLDRAIDDQVAEALDHSPVVALEKGVGPPESGVYALYHAGGLVYVGKASKGTTKSHRTLRDRLNEHVLKISRRRHITLAEVSCRYLTFDSEWWVSAAEFALVNRYDPEWNYSGFGSKTPGRGRPGTERVSPWDQEFPEAE
ncbi:MAG: Eco29kI family restriction endonuclease [bacterium]